MKCEVLSMNCDVWTVKYELWSLSYLSIWAASWQNQQNGMDAQTDLSLRWAHSHIVSFVMRWLIYI